MDRQFGNLGSLAGAIIDGILESAQGNDGVIYAGFLAGFLPAF
jgi:dihydroxyacetone kinase-like predicted kinase